MSTSGQISPTTVHRMGTVNGEPYLPLPTHAHVVLTPFRSADQNAMVGLCNIPSVGMWFYHRAYPYAASDFQLELAKTLPEQEQAIAAIKANERPSTFPFKVIRDVRTNNLIGEVGIFPSPEHPPSEEVWELSYTLHPDYQGQGIARAAVRESVEWARTVLGVKKLEAYAQPRNSPSTKLLDKLNFKVLDVKTYPWPEEKGGGEATAARYMKVL